MSLLKTLKRLIFLKCNTKNFKFFCKPINSWKNDHIGNTPLSSETSEFNKTAKFLEEKCPALPLCKIK